jgi:hypothetical protein
MAKIGAKVGAGSERKLTIPAPNFKTIAFKIVGDSQYVQERFPDKVMREMEEKQVQGQQTVKRAKHGPKDFDKLYEDAQYRPQGTKWPNGAIPATAIKAAMIAACRLVDFKMTESKQVFRILQDGFDPTCRIPLVRITKGTPKPFKQALRNANGNPDIRVRPLWEPGWEAVVRIEYDGDRLTDQDIGNLLLRAGMQVGIGAGRPASKNCAGCGWGTFKLGTN